MMAVAVGGSNGHQRRAAAFPGRTMTNRLNNKKKGGAKIGSTLPSGPLGDINSSIEKMSLEDPGQDSQKYQPNGETMLVNEGNSRTRRDSSWTVSTEGYGSMRSSDQVSTPVASSRRASELSAASSNISTRAMMNSPWEMSVGADSSRRGSLNGQTPSQDKNPMSHHLSRLHRKAQNAIHSQPKSPAVGHPVPQVPQQQQPQSNRRASDPVRALDRNFGVGNQGQVAKNQRSGSFNHINTLDNRMPIHGQSFHGAPGYTPVRPASVGPNQFQQYNSMSNPTSNGFPGYHQNQDWQQNQMQSYAGFGNGFQYPNGSQEYFNGQQWNQDHQQWNGHQQGQWADWQRQQHPGQDGSNSSYQRTLEYVQQCQSSWTNQTNAQNSAQQ